MNKWEQEVQQSLLNDEKEALAELERLYKKALKDIGDKVKAFAYDISVLDAALEEEGLDDAQRKLLQSRRQAKVYQKQYQDALQGQISDVVDKLHADEYETLHGYLTECYDNAFMGTLYNIQKQGIPLMLPIDQTAAVRAVLLNSKLSAGLYARLGIDLMQMKADVSREVTRGIAANMQYRDIARNIKNVSGVTMGRGRLIARTEGHRIQQQSNYDAQQRAKGIGADVVKQWDATLDSRTRESHVAVDGEIREIDKPFSNGLMFPGDPAGAAAEVCNCRCTSNTRAKWALSAEQTKWLGDVSEMTDKQKEQISGKLGIPVDELENYSKTIIPLNAKGFDDFKEKYKALQNPEDERIIREAEERIAGYKAARKTKKTGAASDSGIVKGVKDDSKAATEFKELSDAIDFGYGNYSSEDYNKWWDDYEAHNMNVRLSKEELQRIEDYTEGGFIGFNDVSRFKNDELLKKGYSVEDIDRIRKKADVLEGALSKYDLDTDIVTHRFERDVSWLTGNGNGIEDLEKLIGTEYTTEGFTSSGMLPNRFRFTGGKSDAVHFEIVTPKGTNGAFLSMSKKGENEFLYNRNTKYRVLDGGERIVKEQKMNFKTWELEDVEIKERFLKVQVIPDNIGKTIQTEKAGSVVVSKTAKAINTKKFNVAKTLEEAETFIKEYVDVSKFGAVGVSYKGIDVDVANVVNKRISELFDTYDVDKIGGIIAPAGNTKLGKLMTGATAAYSPVRDSFLLNRNNMKNIKTAMKAFDAETEAITNLLNHPEKYDFTKLSSRVRNVVERSKTSGRATVPATIEEALDHEFGHKLEKHVYKSDLWEDASKNIEKYADKISGYAGESKSEYIAESFTSYMKGETVADPVLVKIFESLKR